jgi:hypothetical protein
MERLLDLASQSQGTGTRRTEAMSTLATLIVALVLFAGLSYLVH